MSEPRVEMAWRISDASNRRCRNRERRVPAPEAVQLYDIPADAVIADVDRLELAGTWAWGVLMKDERIRYPPGGARGR
ncbi:MAG TPA: hypothetical protein VES02_00145 [Dermatophilaceae bacterium]|nr:hypothetical protein [Dermatophilaceae bacterium]